MSSRSTSTKGGPSQSAHKSSKEQSKGAGSKSRRKPRGTARQSHGAARGSSQKPPHIPSPSSSTYVAQTFLARNGAASGFSSGNDHELVATFDDFLDYQPDTSAWLKYVVDAEQEFFASSVSGSGVARAIPKRVQVFVLPKAVNAAVATASGVVQYASPAALHTNDAGTPLSLVAQRTTLVHPTFNTKWKLVGDTDFNKVFRSAQLFPGGLSPVAGSRTGAAVVLFALGIFNPDDGVTTVNGWQLMVRTTFSLTLPLNTGIRAATAYQPNSSDIDPADFSLARQFAMIHLQSTKETR